ncbi:ABC transporter substrate-binding protein [Caenimonas terrae]|uniref:ABC transporter substrate-binding protein n=1 Tax=Caenimonas terrae TaxID=696074 RepID=A0ABW0NEH7_9BURK
MLATTRAAWCQPGHAQAHPLVVAQVVDLSNEQQDVSRDFLVGSRAAWQDVNAGGGLRGRPIQHLVLEVDGTPASLQAVLRSVRDNPACIALSGTVSDPAATQLAALLRQEALAIAHVAPWLQNSMQEIDERTFPIFAARREQIAHALKSLSATGVREVGAVFASRREHALYREDAARIAAGLRLGLRSYPGDLPLAQLGQQMDQATPAVLLFIGGTPELVQFTQGLDRQARQRYVVALADVNLQTVLQMGGARATPVIATQVVPMVTASSVPIVRRYREVLARLFDEQPTALSLAGFIAARYTAEVLAGIDGAVTRASALAAFQKLAALDLGGYRVAFDGSRRSAGYVTQSMLTADGRVVG